MTKHMVERMVVNALDAVGPVTVVDDDTVDVDDTVVDVLSVGLLNGLMAERVVVKAIDVVELAAGIGDGTVGVGNIVVDVLSV